MSFRQYVKTLVIDQESSFVKLLFRDQSDDFRIWGLKMHEEDGKEVMMTIMQ